MTKIKLKSVIEFLFWIVLFVFALAFFNKNWNLSFYFIIGALLFLLLIVEIILNLEHRHKAKVKKRKRIKNEQIKQNKRIFLKELTSLFSFVVVLIVVFSVIIQKNKFIEFLSFKPFHLYFMMILVVIALVIMILQFIGHRKTKKKKQKTIKQIPKAKKEKKIKEKHIKFDKKKFYKQLTLLFSFIVVLIAVFLLIIQKNKFIEFLSFRHYHSYFILTSVVVALIIIILNFVEHMQVKKKFELTTKMKYDFIFLFGLIVVIVAYVFKNWITALLGLTLMIISLVVHHLSNKKIMLIKETTPKKIISKKIQKDRKLKLLLESPVGMLTEIRKEEERAKQETRMEKLKLKELQRKIREEAKRKKREERLRKTQEKSVKARGITEQKRIEAEKKKLEKIKKSREEILNKEKKLGKIQKDREEIERIIKTKKGLKPKARYETDFDRLLELIKKYERLKLSDVAKIFGISIKKAEAWTTILEQHNLVEVHYPAIGEPELKIKK